MYQSNRRQVENVRYEDESDKNLYNSTVYLISVVNMIVFGLGLVMFVVGILFLTTYRYNYSFTTFSVDLMAGIFVASGSVMMLYSLMSVFTLRPYGRPVLVILYAVVIIILFLLLFILGVIGLSMGTNGEFRQQNRNNMFITAKSYDEGNQNRHATRKINWLHKTFACCGVDSYNDWKTTITNFRSPVSQVQFVDKYRNENKYPYIDDVPDSCCINQHFNCGKQINVFGRDRSTIINTKGCLEIYNKQFTRDIIFLSALSTSIASVMLFIFILLLFTFSLIRKNHAYLIRYADNATKRALLN